MTNERSLQDSLAVRHGGSQAPTPWRAVVLLAVVEAAVVGLLVTAFAWPSLNLEPRDVPIAVAGPAPAVTSVESALDQARPGAFDVQAVPEAEAALALIEDREVYGALVLGPEGPQEVLVASAASPLVAQVLTDVAAGLARPDAGAAQAGPAVVDVAPTPDGDPRGLGLAAGALPLILAGVITGAAMALRVRGPGRRLAGAGLTALLVGPVVVGILHGWLGALDGNVLAETGVVALGVLAGALLVLGGHALFGVAGLGIGAAVMVLLGNPLSAATSAPELLPTGWAQLGQALPPGALVDALRGVSGFGGAGVGAPLTILVGWIVLGSLAVLLAPVLRRRRTQAEATVPAPATAVTT